MSKYRNDFVTNSSSSSFIIAYRRNKAIEEQSHIYADIIHDLLIGELGGRYSDSSTDVISSKENWDELFLERYDYRIYPDEAKTPEELFKILEEKEGSTRDNDCEIKLYYDVLDYINKGYIVLDKSVDYSDKTQYEIINTLSKDDSENFIIVLGE